MAENPLVLVTGASGFIGTHIVQQLLQSGQYKVILNLILLVEKRVTVNVEFPQTER